MCIQNKLDFPNYKPACGVIPDCSNEFLTCISNWSVLLYHTLLNAERSCAAEPVPRGVSGGGLTAAVAGAASLQTTYAAHDQWSLHTVPKCAPFLLPEKLPLLSFPLQPPEAHYQVQWCLEWQQVVPVMLRVFMIVKRLFLVILYPVLQIPSQLAHKAALLHSLISLNSPTPNPVS